MLSIGIDVSKGKSTVCGMKPGGEIVYAPFEVQHTREGMLELVSLLRGSGYAVCVSRTKLNRNKPVRKHCNILSGKKECPCSVSGSMCPKEKAPCAE